MIAAAATVTAFLLGCWAAYWTGREDGREAAESRQRLHCATCVRAARRRHPSRPRPATGQAAVDQWLAENYGGQR